MSEALPILPQIGFLRAEASLPILEKLSTDCPMNSTTSWLARLILLTGLILSDLAGYQI